MKITADTNLLVRALTGDDDRQSTIAHAVLAEAELVAMPLSSLCEVAWVLSRGYKASAVELAEGIRRLVDGSNVIVNRSAVDAGFAMLKAGGDFADGVIAYDGKRLGGEIFVSFDKKAVKCINAQGGAARLLA